MRETGDLNTFRLQVDGAAPASLDDLFDQLCNFYEKAISWYLVEKHRKGRASKMLRIISLLLLVVGGMVPLGLYCRFRGWLFMIVRGVVGRVRLG